MLIRHAVFYWNCFRRLSSGLSAKSKLAVDMKIAIHIHIHIHRFSVDIHGYIHGYPWISISTDAYRAYLL